MGIKDRPYVGTWELNQQALVRHTPDCLVYINGHLEIPGCQSCSGRINLQKFITSVTVDPTLQPPATAQVSMQIPRHYGDDLFRDGQFLLTTGLEVHIYIRGYFPVAGMLGEMGTGIAEDSGLQDAVMHPYYLVHHGVVTEVSHEYSGGEHTASLNCADLLHFWQYQRLATNASAFGTRPTNSKVRMNLVGHSLTAQTPFGIIYNLWRDSFGAAGGVEFAMGNSTNSAADSTGFNESLWSFAIRYWEQRFSESMMSLRIYGVDGSLYNSFEQAFLASISTNEAQTLAKHDFANMTDKQVADFEGTEMWKQARAIGFDITSVRLGAASERDAQRGNNLGINATQIQAFVSDLSNWGNVNLWESQYETKLDIANNVAQKSGFEFYMDVDGDLVFKPPFYNLDTRDAPAYNIRPVDIISISFREAEPEATTVKGTADAFTNLVGTGLSGEFGIRAEYVDYRLVAKYGWRQQTFESQYFGNPRAMFFSAVNRMDLFNIGVRSASCQIPIRAELRPGYPVYIQHMDMYGYLQSLSHSFQFGGQCTTTLNLVGLRAKFLPPGTPSGATPTTADIDLQATTKPKLALQMKDPNTGHPMLVGTPNVVMGIDMQNLNPMFYVVGADLENLDTEAGLLTLIRAAKRTGVLTLPEASDGEESLDSERVLTGPYVLHSGQGLEQPLGTFTDLLGQIQAVRKAVNDPYAEGETTEDREARIAEAEGAAAELYALVAAMGGPVWTSIEKGQQTWNYLDALNDMKAKFNPGGNIPGYYRYYSSSLEDKVAQGQNELIADETADQASTTAGAQSRLTEPVTVRGLVDGPSGVEWGDVTCEYGLPIVGVAKPTEVTPTHRIQTLSFAEHKHTVLVSRPARESGNLPTMPYGDVKDGLLAVFFGVVASGDVDSKYQTLFEAAKGVIDNTFGAGTVGYSWTSLKERIDSDYALAVELEGGVADSETETDEGFFVDEMSSHLADFAVAAFRSKVAGLIETFGDPNGEPPQGISYEDSADAWNEVGTFVNNFYIDLDDISDSDNYFYSSASGANVTNTFIKVPQERSVYTPVFPVSDARGYEVVGSYRYGRGLSVNPGGTWEQVSTGTGGNSWNDINAVEAFLAGVVEADINNDGLLSAEEAAALAEKVGLNQSLIMAVEGEGKTVFEQRLMNRIANEATDRVFKTTVVNAAYSLADMGEGITRNVCECKGAAADLFLQAFTETAAATTVEVSQPDEVSQWLSNAMVQQSVPWSTSQAALRGEYEESTAGLLTQAVESLSGESRRQLAQQSRSALEEAANASQERERLSQDQANFQQGADQFNEEQ